MILTAYAFTQVVVAATVARRWYVTRNRPDR